MMMMQILQSKNLIKKNSMDVSFVLKDPREELDMKELLVNILDTLEITLTTEDIEEIEVIEDQEIDTEEVDIETEDQDLDLAPEKRKEDTEEIEMVVEDMEEIEVMEIDQEETDIIMIDQDIIVKDQDQEKEKEDIRVLDREALMNVYNGQALNK